MLIVSGIRENMKGVVEQTNKKNPSHFHQWKIPFLKQMFAPVIFFLPNVANERRIENPCRSIFLPIICKIRAKKYKYTYAFPL